MSSIDFSIFDSASGIWQEPISDHVQDKSSEDEHENRSGRKTTRSGHLGLRNFVPFLAAIALIGCSSGNGEPQASSLDVGRKLYESPPGSEQEIAYSLERRASSGGTAAAARGGPNVAEDILQDIPGGAVAKSVRSNRKIIYTALVDLVTDDLNSLEPKLLAMVSEAGGFVAETNQSGSAGGQRSATWRIRVPVDAYDGFLQKTRTLGEVRSVQVNSQDVTEEFVDVTARVAAKKVQEQRLIDLIKNATANLEDVLKVESELARVRAEIERMEGRLRLLKDQTDLTTVTVSVKEIKDYVPPEAPTYATKLQRTWADSIDLLLRNLGDFVLGVVAWAPFLPFYLAGWGVVLWLMWRGWRKIRPALLADLQLMIKPNAIGDVPRRENDPPDAP